MTTKTSTARRKFLTTLGAGGVAAAAVAITKMPVPERRVEQPPTPHGKGYQLSEHVRNYYRTAKV